MSEIERYDPEVDSSEVYQGMFPATNGDWVDYDDYMAEVTRLTKVARDAYQYGFEAGSLMRDYTKDKG